MPTRRSTKKVQFFEICDEGGARIETPLPWDSALGRIGRQSPPQRRHVVSGVPHWGQAYVYDDREHLVLAKLRADGVSTFDIENDEIVDRESEAAMPYVELSITSILPGTNKFGLVRQSNAASHAVTIGDWINAHKLFDRQVSVIPIISQRTMDKIRNAQEIKLLKVGYDERLSAASAVTQSGGLSSAVNSLVEETGPADIEIVVRQKGRLNTRGRDLRQNIARLARVATGRPFTQANVEIVTTAFDGRDTTEYINLLNDIVARRMTVSVTDDEGNPVRIPSAIAAINRAAAFLRDDLAA